jgi:hypothetical protein
LQVRAEPSQAALQLDGDPVPNPYESVLPRGERHVLQASAPGYEPQSVALTLTRNREVLFRLERVRPTRRPAAKRPAEARPAAKPAKGAGFVDESPY